MKKQIGKEITIDLGVSLRPYQMEVSRGFKRFNVLCWHRRAGKSFWGAWWLVIRACLSIATGKRKNYQFAYVAPTKEQARKIIWDYLKDFTKNLPGIHYNEQTLTITISFPGRTTAKIFLLSAENYSSIRGMYMDGVVCDEYAEWDPRAWRTVIRQTLVDRNGWAVFIGTSHGPNHFAELYHEAEGREGWYCNKITVEDSKVIDEEELADMRKDMTDDEYAQEMMCSFAGSTEGYYYSHIIEKLRESGQILTIPFVPSIEVFTFWDLGISDYMSIWYVQKAAGQIRVLRYDEFVGKGIPEVAKIMREYPYIYGKHVLPHDGGHREVGSGRTRQASLEDIMGIGSVIVLERVGVADGINAVRELLHECFFDKAGTELGIKRLSKYVKEFDHKTNVYNDRPKHDESSHGADGFRTFANGLRVLEYSTKRDLKKRSVRAKMDYDPFNF